VFDALLTRNGEPPSWSRPATFGTLVRLILEQQVSLASASAAYGRLEESIGEPLPAPFLELSDDELRAIGFSRQKTRYTRGIAHRMLDGSLDLDRVVAAGEAGSDELLAITGIGPWTVACFEIFVARRADRWPTGDRALYVSMTRNLGLAEVPDRATCDSIAAEWAPYRSTAARMLWHDYLGGARYVVDPNAGFIDDGGMVST
jgi:DNA-3-methyladenine glycosylase II